MAAETRGDHDEAIRAFTEELARPNLSDTQKSNLYAYRCLAYERKLEAEKALADCSEVIRLKPDSSSAYSDRGVVYFRFAQYDLAIADLDVAIRLRPDNAVAYNNRADAYFRKGDNDRAVADFDEALRLAPNLAYAYQTRGQIYLQKGDQKRAIQEETDAIHSNPKLGSAFDTRGMAYAASAEFDAALADLNQAIAISPNSAGFYVDRAMLELALRRDSAATGDLVQSLKLAPSSSIAVIWLHIARQRAGEGDAAEMEKNVAAVDQTRWPAPIIALYRNQFDPQKLIDLSKEASGKGVDLLRCQIDFHVGEFDLFKKNITAAKPLLNKAAQSCPNYFGEKFLAETEVKEAGIQK